MFNVGRKLNYTTAYNKKIEIEELKVKAVAHSETKLK